MEQEERLQLCLFDEEEMKRKIVRTKTNKKESYEEFVQKFKEKREKTTDDCYTPEEVYNVVCEFVRTLEGVGDRTFVRPFYPGGDYERYEYPEGCIVVDNPPFSLYKKIIDFYEYYHIDYFLFAPHLSMFVGNEGCCFITTSAKVTYENGAVVNTSFVTNLVNGVRIWLNGDLKEKIENCQCILKEKLKKLKHNKNIISSALLGKYIRKGTDIKIKNTDCFFIKNIEYLKNRGEKIFGGAFLISDEIREELDIERKRVLEMYYAGFDEYRLSEREMKILEELNNM